MKLSDLFFTGSLGSSDLYMHQVTFDILYDGVDNAHPSATIYFTYYSHDDTQIEKTIQGLYEFIRTKGSLICYGLIHGVTTPQFMMEVSPDAIHMHPSQVSFPLDAPYYCGNSIETISKV